MDIRPPLVGVVRLFPPQLAQEDLWGLVHGTNWTEAAPKNAPMHCNFECGTTTASIIHAMIHTLNYRIKYMGRDLHTYNYIYIYYVVIMRVVLYDTVCVCVDLC